MNDVVIKSAAWATRLEEEWRYYCLYGGRGGGKTTEVAQKLILDGSQKKLIVGCVRQFQNSIAESVKPALEAQIHACGLSHLYVITEKYIDCPVTGTHFFFKGIDRNVMSIKGWEDVDILWLEEANTTKHDAWELIDPTIRKPGSKIIVTFNRHSRADPIDKFFLGGNPPEDALIIKVNWQDNPFFTKELNNSRLHSLKTDPDRYAHIWEGEPDDSPNGKVLLPMAKLMKCVDAHKKLGWKPSGVRHGGLDVADSETGDHNAFARRQGPLVYMVEKWRAKFLHETSKRADEAAREDTMTRLFFDATGVGSGIKSEFSKVTNRRYSVKPFRFGDPVKGPETSYLKTGEKPILNKDYFSRQNAQAGWNVKQRVENTIKALNGDKVDLETCFFISSDIPNLEEYLIEMAQPVYDYDVSDRIKVDKSPDDKPSPDMYDATVMAFAHDFRNGLKAN